MGARLTLPFLIIIVATLLVIDSCQKEKVKIPPTVTTSPVTDITNTTVTSGGTISNDGGAQVTARGVCWSTLPDSISVNSPHTTDSSGIGKFVSNITGLTRSTKYYVRAYAVNIMGVAYGDTVSFISFNATPVNGSVYADVSDYFSPFLNRPGQLFVDWSPYNSNTWQLSLGNHPDQPIDLSNCRIFLPGPTPPIKSASYTLQPNYTALTNGTASINYSGSKFREFPFHFYSTSGQLDVIVTNGQVSVLFSNVPAINESGEVLSMSGHITCH